MSADSAASDPAVPTEPAPPEPVAAEPDPVLARRVRIATWAAYGKRFGYAAMGAAVLVFFAGFPFGFRPWMVTTIVTAIAVSSVMLIPAIIAAYAVRAAERDEAAGGGLPPGNPVV